MAPPLATRHSSKGNYLMLDGHVESLPPSLDRTYFKKIQ
jgi:prepilin-type processing-associated H-X9-DG protein